MTMQAEQEENVQTAEAYAPPSNAEIFRMLVRMKLKLIANYVLDGFAPVAAVLALIIAVIAISNSHSSQTQLGKSATTIDSLNSSLAASRGELEKLKSAMAQEKTKKEEENSKQNEQMAKIVQNVSRLQVKMKISPTLEEQLHQAVSAPAVTAADANASAAPAAAPASTDANKKPASQVQVLTKAIEKFNEKGHK